MPPRATPSLPPLLALLVLGAAACSSRPLAAPALARSDDGRPAPREGVETFAFTSENDFYIGADDHYTNGFGFTWVSRDTTSYPPGSLRRRLGELGSFLPFVGDDGYLSFMAITIGQEMFTPEDITLRDPLPTDQPYAGVLFLDASFLARNDRTSHAWTVRLGLVGPASGAEQLQNAWHELSGSEEAQGWHTQLPDEPVVNVDYGIAHEWLSAGPAGQPYWRLVPVGGVSAGTYTTGARAALYTEVGWNLPETIGFLSVREGLDPLAAVTPTDQRPFSLSLYAGGGAFALAHHLPLDGTVFRESRSVRSEPLVGFASAGLAARYRRISLALLITTFTDKFETQVGSERFGTLTLSYTH